MMSFFETEQEKQRNARFQKIMAAQPEEKYRKPSPLGDNKFPEENFVSLNVVQNKKEIKLNTYRYLPLGGEKEIKAVLIIFHGLNSHTNKCAHIAKCFAEQGIVVLGFDHRGFGKSEGLGGYIENQETHLSDSEQFIGLVEQMYPKYPLFIGGQSLGGQTCFLLGLKFPQRFRGIIFYAPAIKDNEYNAKVGKIFAKMVGAIYPTFEAASQSRGLANKNPQCSEENDKDPYMYMGKIRPGTIRVILNNSDFCFKNYQNFNVPFLAIQGEIDKLVDPDGSKILIERSPQKDKELLYYDNLWHNIWGEEEIEDINPKTVAWLLKRI